MTRFAHNIAHQKIDEPGNSRQRKTQYKAERDHEDQRDHRKSDDIDPHLDDASPSAISRYDVACKH